MLNYRRHGKVEPLTRDLTECEEGIRKSRREQEHYAGKKAEYVNNAQEKAALVLQKRGELARAIEKTKGRHPRVFEGFQMYLYQTIVVCNVPDTVGSGLL